jgi:hypothetical protein
MQKRCGRPCLSMTRCCATRLRLTRVSCSVTQVMAWSLRSHPRGRLEAAYGDPLAALDYITQSIRTLHDSGNTVAVRGALSILAAVFDRLGRYEPAATMAGFAVIPYTAMLAEFNTLIAHLRDVLGEATYESLARKGETMTTAEIATHAYDQIDQARAELNAVSK